MSYVQFLLLFLVLPLAGIITVARRQMSHSLIFTLLAVSLIAIAYTGPWDNAIIENGVWSYGSHQVTGVLIGHVPIEEYGFYVLQVLLTGFLTVVLLARIDES